MRIIDRHFFFGMLNVLHSRMSFRMEFFVVALFGRKRVINEFVFVLSIRLQMNHSFLWSVCHIRNNKSKYGIRIKAAFGLVSVVELLGLCTVVWLVKT